MTDTHTNPTDAQEGGDAAARFLTTLEVTEELIQSDVTVVGQIRTFTNKYVSPLELKPEDVNIDDIAHALSLQCRFAGHVQCFYSVAEHSCRVAAWVNRNIIDRTHKMAAAAAAVTLAGHNGRVVDPARGVEAMAQALPRMFLSALLHDSAEAYLSDVPRPLKRLPEFDFYRQAEERAELAIGTALGAHLNPMHALVREADTAVLKWEFANIKNGPVRGWSPWMAEDKFLSFYSNLRPDHEDFEFYTVLDSPWWLS